MDFFIDAVLHIDQYLNDIVQEYHLWTYAILFLIIFCETGLVLTPFLPGDSLLFMAGAVTASPDTPLDVRILILILCMAASLGDFCNYLVGYWGGYKLCNHPKLKILKEEHIKKHMLFCKVWWQNNCIGTFCSCSAYICSFCSRDGKNVLFIFWSLQLYWSCCMGKFICPFRLLFGKHSFCPKAYCCINDCCYQYFVDTCALGDTTC